MCGFTGFYSISTGKSRSENHVIGKAMCDAIHHRGPDYGDLWQDADVSLLLAHRRLSILDLSPEGAQPMHSPSGRYVIVFNGEIYNHLDIRAEIEDQCEAFRGRSDTETLLAAIDVWGLNRALQKLSGMFAFALWDRKTRQLHFVRDRMGKKPLYIGWAGKSLVFGSELKSVSAHPDFTREVDRGSLAQMIEGGYCQAPHCIYKGVWSLPAGHRVSLDLAALEPAQDLSQEMIPYWHGVRAMEAAKSDINHKSEDEIIEEFDALLTSCVQERLISDVPLGAFLSGGIDSSSVVAIMQKLSTRPVKTYTIGFKDAGFDEAVYAKKVAAHLGSDHHEMYVSASDALGVITDLPDMYDEPFADISAIPTYLVSKFARESVSVALSGDGGDEMLGGYSRHVQGAQLQRMMHYIPAAIRPMIGRSVRSISPDIWDRLRRDTPQFGNKIHKAASVLSRGSQDDIYAGFLNRFEENPVLAAKAHPPIWQNSDMQVSDQLPFAERMMMWDTLSYLPNDILTKVDRASMAVSLEARAPLLDRRIFDYVWTLPHAMKIRDGGGKYLLKKLLNRYAPNLLFERPKQGFSMPVGDWLRNDLRDWAEDLLDDGKLMDQGYLDATMIRSMWDDHLAGRGNNAQALWHVLMFQAWHARWMKV